MMSCIRLGLLGLFYLYLSEKLDEDFCGRGNIESILTPAHVPCFATIGR